MAGSNVRIGWWPHSRIGWAGAAVGALLLTVAVTYVVWSHHSVVSAYRELLRLYSSRRTLRLFVQGFGPYAPLVFIAIQALQVVVAPIPGELTGILGGYVFGVWLGFAYSTAGLTIGSIVAFLVGRGLGGAVVRRVISDALYRKFDFLTRPGGELVTLICFLIPGFPKDYLCFLLGASRLPLLTFVVLSTLGRLPGTWLLSIQGAKILHAQYAEVVLYGLVAVTAVGAAALYRDRVFAWMHRRQPHRRPDGHGDG